MKKKVTLYFNSGLLHFTQLITGLEYLRDQGEIDLKYIIEDHIYPVDIFKIRYSNKIIFFDMADSCIIKDSLYEESDFYFKRMLLKKDFWEKSKLRPYGLNYQVYYKNKFLKYLFIKNKRLLKYSLRFSPIASSVLNIKDCIINNELSKMQSVPSTRIQILFRSRLWNPDNNELHWKKEERKVLNEERIRLNRILKKHYGSNFKGGIQKDQFSVHQCKDLLLRKQEYHKRNYLKILKSSSIGIVNPGLEGSISWKFGEYISHSLAIISTPIEEFELLGPLQEEEHYLTYNSPEECLEKTERLYSNNNLRRSIQQANREYYQNWLHPGVKMRKILELIDS
ncbi:glycosyltransferase [Salegentibacter sp. LM13S]|uniref:glycosyltransferase n=1 Tax=Salegentibacter lacus TaxID=2873599 RepID=UPI001CCAD328|nr:glycosyltransferase [Salegentibacter lacus]MBZ9632368.1 glycosyltransferase [Salegentibacter lacus]